ncbi:hypothetical protein ACMA5I_03495 [Paracoccaceae bacterium GXU_MW_L88]
MIRLTLAATLIPALAAAQPVLTCNFTQECYGEEACQETGYEVSIEKDEAGLLDFVDPSATVPQASGPNDVDADEFGPVTVYTFVTEKVGEDDIQTHHALAVVTETGQANLQTLITDVPLQSILYTGTCEEAE